MSDEMEKAEIDRAFNEALKTHLYLRDPYCYRVGYIDGTQWQAERAKAEIERLRKGLEYIASKRHMIGKPKWDAEFVDVAERVLRGEFMR